MLDLDYNLASMGRKHRKMSDKEAEETLTQQLVETGKREELKAKVKSRVQEII